MLRRNRLRYWVKRVGFGLGIEFFKMRYPWSWMVEIRFLLWRVTVSWRP